MSDWKRILALSVAMCILAGCSNGNTPAREGTGKGAEPERETALFYAVNCESMAAELE